MIITDKYMFHVNKIKYIDIEERPIFNYDTKQYDHTSYYIVMHIDLNSHEVNNITIQVLNSKKEAKEYLINLSTILRELETGRLVKVVL